MSSKSPPPRNEPKKKPAKARAAGVDVAPKEAAPPPMNAKQKAIWAIIAVVAVAGAIAAMYRSAHKKARIPADAIALGYESLCVREEKTGIVRCRRPGQKEFEIIPELKGATDLGISAGGIVCARFGKDVSCFNPQKTDVKERVVRERFITDAVAFAPGVRSAVTTEGGKVVIWDDPRRAETLPFPKDMAKGCVGVDYGCALGKDKKAHCVGQWPICTTGNGSCEIGDNVKDVACGSTHACVLHEDGTVACVGKNLMGELGRGTVSNDERVGPVIDVRDVVQISVGLEHTCVRHANHTLSCFGDAWGRRKPTPKPEPLPGVFGVSALVSWGHDACAVADGGYVICLGYTGGLAAKTGPLTVPTPVFLAKE